MEPARAVQHEVAQDQQRPAIAGPLTLLLLGICLAALWIGTNLVFPVLAPTGIPSAVTRLAIHGAILFGIWRGLVRADIPPARRLLVWLAIAVPFSLWLAVIWQAAISGAFQLAPGVPRLPRLPLAIALPLMIGLPPLLLSRAVATVLDAIPAPWLVALQVYRVFGGIFLVNWAHGAVSGYFAWPAGIGDVIIWGDGASSAARRCFRHRARTPRGADVEHLRPARLRGSNYHGSAQCPGTDAAHWL